MVIEIRVCLFSGQCGDGSSPKMLKIYQFHFILTVSCHCGDHTGEYAENFVEKKYYSIHTLNIGPYKFCDVESNRRLSGEHNNSSFKTPPPETASLTLFRRKIFIYISIHKHKDDGTSIRLDLPKLFGISCPGSSFLFGGT